jgi:hypothetical protein
MGYDGLKFPAAGNASGPRLRVFRCVRGTLRFGRNLNGASRKVQAPCDWGLAADTGLAPGDNIGARLRAHGR